MEDQPDTPMPAFIVPPMISVPERELALYLAVMHHGFACGYGHGHPSGKDTVLRTAETFRGYLNGHPVPEGVNRVSGDASEPR